MQNSWEITLTLLSASVFRVVKLSTKNKKKKKYRDKKTTQLRTPLLSFDKYLAAPLRNRISLVGLYFKSETKELTLSRICICRVKQFDDPLSSIDATLCVVYAQFTQRVQSPTKSLPVYPVAQVQTYSRSDFRLHVAPYRHGDESHAFSMGISQRLAVNPTGQEQANEGVPPPLLSFTLHEPPFWHRGPVWHGFRCWQYSPTYFDVHLQQRAKSTSVWGETWKFLFTSLYSYLFIRLFFVSLFSDHELLNWSSFFRSNFRRFLIENE